jgi:CheY-like chemotaxis protein
VIYLRHMNSPERDTILIIDDDDPTRVSFRSQFEALGYRVEEATDGEEAMRLLRRGLRPGIIVLDLEMPFMAGDQFRRAQLASSELKGIPVVLVSSTWALDEIAELLRVDAYSEKPLNPEKMLAIVERHCLKADRCAGESAVAAD